jgi:hypothetical protein
MIWNSVFLPLKIDEPLLSLCEGCFDICVRFSPEKKNPRFCFRFVDSNEKQKNCTNDHEHV